MEISQEPSEYVKDIFKAINLQYILENIDLLNPYLMGEVYKIKDKENRDDDDEEGSDEDEDGEHYLFTPSEDDEDDFGEEEDEEGEFLEDDDNDSENDYDDYDDESDDSDTDDHQKKRKKTNHDPNNTDRLNQQSIMELLSNSINILNLEDRGGKDEVSSSESEEEGEEDIAPTTETKPSEKDSEKSDSESDDDIEGEELSSEDSEDAPIQKQLKGVPKEDIFNLGSDDEDEKGFLQHTEYFKMQSTMDKIPSLLRGITSQYRNCVGGWFLLTNNSSKLRIRGGRNPANFIMTDSQSKEKMIEKILSVAKDAPFGDLQVLSIIESDRSGIENGHQS